MSKTYSEKLRDPRWQKKRLEILERDGWYCQICLSEKETLQVHHIRYHKGDPWDTPSCDLTSFCETCHERVENIKRGIGALLINKDGVEAIDAVFKLMSDRDLAAKAAMILRWLGNGDAFWRIAEAAHDLAFRSFDNGRSLALAKR